jgi:hypothetical protein
MNGRTYERKNGGTVFKESCALKGHNQQHRATPCVGNVYIATKPQRGEIHLITPFQGLINGAASVRRALPCAVDLRAFSPSPVYTFFRSYVLSFPRSYVLPFPHSYVINI